MDIDKTDLIHGLFGFHRNSTCPEVENENEVFFRAVVARAKEKLLVFLPQPI
jgi:hypothetical protein